MKIKEEFLHFIWRHAMFNSRELSDEQGQIITIVDRGIYNTNAGPDFLEAKVKIGNELWAGSVEFHMKPSDWFHHKHHFDERYDNVILHVVYSCNGEDEIIKKLNIPTLTLKGLIPKIYLTNYLKLKFEKGKLPCSSYVKGMDRSLLNIYYESLLVSRFEYKVSSITQLYKENNYDLAETIYQTLALAWGLKVNKLAFLTLARRVPFKLVRKNGLSRNKIEAIYFGQAGLLPEEEDKDVTINTWQKDYDHIKRLYALESMEKREWYFHKLRPRAFPTIRISLWSKFMFMVPDLGGFISDFTLKESSLLLGNLDVSSYWRSHYMFGVSSISGNKKLGANGIRNVLINAIIPLKLFLSRLNSINQDVWDSILFELPKLKPENNQITRKMESNGFNNFNVSNSQAILHLHQTYCISKKCLNCRIGNEIMRRK